MNRLSYPVRINRYLALKNIASRREADRLIKAGKIKLNGRLAKPGDQVNEADRVEVDQPYSDLKENFYRYLAFNKPRGVVTNEEQGQTSIGDLISSAGSKNKLVPMGRLDKDSGGLIILTNDTRLTNKLLSPEYHHEKEYLVKVDKNLTPMFQKQITAGVKLETGRTKPCRLKKVAPDEFYLTLTEGRKHQIRRMCAALGYQVKDLQRVRIMNVRLGQLKPGEWKNIEGAEQEKFLKQLDLK